MLKLLDKLKSWKSNTSSQVFLDVHIGSTIQVRLGIIHTVVRDVTL